MVIQRQQSRVGLKIAWKSETVVEREVNMASKIKIPAKKTTLKRKPLSKATVESDDTKHIEGKNDPHLADEPTPLDLQDRKFILTQQSAAKVQEPPAYEYLGELPDSYGTKKLFIVARDPQWIFAYWDLTWQQYQEAAHAAHDGKVFLQLYWQNGTRAQQIQVNESSRNWYLHVGQPDTTFYAELGYYCHDGHFEVISRSAPATTPRDNLSWKTEARFVTIPFHYSFSQLFEMIKGHILPEEELADALARLQEDGFNFPFAVGKGASLSPEQHNDLVDYLAGDFTRRRWVGSLEITETLRRRLQEMVSSGQWISSGGVSSMSSPFGGRERGFHMHVNAELIIYGGTDPNAKVRIDGQDITLRPDGTFSYHFTFPDGKFHIPIEATAPDGEERRSAMLSFLRMSAYEGDVRKTGQAPMPEPLGRFE